MRAAETHGGGDLSGQARRRPPTWARACAQNSSSPRSSAAPIRADLVGEEPVEPGPRDAGILSDLADGRAADSGGAQAALGGIQETLARA